MSSPGSLLYKKNKTCLEGKDCMYFYYCSLKLCYGKRPSFCLHRATTFSAGWTSQKRLDVYSESVRLWLWVPTGTQSSMKWWEVIYWFMGQGDISTLKSLGSLRQWKQNIRILRSSLPVIHYSFNNGTPYEIQDKLKQGALTREIFRLLCYVCKRFTQCQSKEFEKNT